MTAFKDWYELQRGEKGWVIFWLILLSLAVFNGFTLGYTVAGFANTILCILNLLFYILVFKTEEYKNNFRHFLGGYLVCFIIMVIMSSFSFPLSYTSP